MRETKMDHQMAQLHDRQMMMPITHIQNANDNTLNKVSLFDLIPTLDTEVEE